MSKVFFSWQSDLPGSRNYLKARLEEAIEDLPEWEIETATRNASGAVDIAENIITKINESSMMVSDVSIINPDSRTRKTPNPIVLYETGYAVGKRGWDAVILIANKDSTSTADLPFDIRNRLMILREFSDENKAYYKNELKRIISNCADTGDQPLDSPYIYLYLQTRSSQSMTIGVKNDEDREYVINSFEILGIEQQLGRAIPAKGEATGIQLDEVPLPPYQQRVDRVSFVVTRATKSYRIFQKIQIQLRATGDYGILGFYQNPERIVEIPFYRDPPTVDEIRNNDFDGRCFFVMDSDTSSRFELKITGTIMAIWGSRHDLDNRHIIRIAKTINDKYSGEQEGGVFEINSENAGSTMEDTLDMINRGSLTFNEND